LTNGETYLYNIASQIEQGDFWNTSINQGSFTYTGSGIVGTGGVNLLLVSTGHPPIGFNFVTGQVISAMDDPAVNFMITLFSGNEAPYSAYGWLSQGTALKDMGLMTPEAFDLLESAPTEGYSVPEYINLTEGHAYAFMLGNGTKGMIVVRSVTVDGTTVTMTFDYKYFGSGAGGDTISYNGKLMTAPNWPGNDGMQPVPSAPVWAVNETGLLRQVQRPFLTAVFRSPGFRHQPASGWMFLPHLQVLCRYGADGTIGTPTLLLNYPLFCSRRHSMKHLATLPVQV
jgi:hypothetical protein